MAAEIPPVPRPHRQFRYLIHDPAGRRRPRIDARSGPDPEGSGTEGGTLTDILVTPSSRRPFRGIAELKPNYNCRVVAPHDKTVENSFVDVRVIQATSQKSDLLGGCWKRRAHTLDHISYVFDDDQGRCSPPHAVLIAAAGCSEGPYPMMWLSAQAARAAR